MKKILALALLAVTCQANAFSVKPPYTGDWTRTEYGAYTPNHLDSDTLAVLINRGNAYEIGFLMIDDDCVNITTDTVEANDVRVDGQLIKFEQRCVEKGLALYQATTKAGSERIFGQFNQGGVVIADDLRFSGKGFSDMYQLISKKVSEDGGLYNKQVSNSTEIAL
jgi:hypothetical protein